MSIADSLPSIRPITVGARPAELGNRSEVASVSRASSWGTSASKGN